MTSRILTASILALGLFAVPRAASAQFLNYTLRLETLASEVQTEHGIDEDDEVYMVMSFLNSRGERGAYRVPNTDIEIQEGNTQNLNIALNAGHLYPNEWALVNVSVMESDQGGVEVAIIGALNNALNNLGTLGCAISDVACAVAGAGNATTSLASSVFSFRGSDDFLGSFSVIITNNNNQYVMANWTPGGGLSPLGALPPQGWNPMTGWYLNNEPPARYWATFRVF
jgi:hypothetical protein